MPTNIRGRAPGLGTQLVGLLAAIRWEAQFKLAKCCMHASKSISDLGVFLAEPVLERSKALNDAGAQLRENVGGTAPCGYWAYRDLNLVQPIPVNA